MAAAKSPRRAAFEDLTIFRSRWDLRKNAVVQLLLLYERRRPSSWCRFKDTRNYDLERPNRCYKSKRRTVMTSTLLQEESAGSWATSHPAAEGLPRGDEEEGPVKNGSLWWLPDCRRGEQNVAVYASMLLGWPESAVVWQCDINFMARWTAPSRCFAPATKYVPSLFHLKVSFILLPVHRGMGKEFKIGSLERIKMSPTSKGKEQSGQLQLQVEGTCCVWNRKEAAGCDFKSMSS